MTSIRVTNVAKRFDRLLALENVCFEVRDGEYMGILGPSGCGKTTLIKCVAGILKPEHGHIYMGEKLLDKYAIEDRGIGYVFQNIALFPHMNVRDNIGYGLRVKQASLEEQRRLVSEMIALIRFSADPSAYPRELSGGMQQKVAVARALTSKTEVLLLDEPLSALDAIVRVELRYELRKIVKDLHLTAIHITHDQEEVMSIADRIIIMKKGQIVEVGTPEQLYFTPKSLFTANFLGEANFIEGKIIGIHYNVVRIKTGEGTVIEANLAAEEMERIETEDEIGARQVDVEKRFYLNQLVVAAIRPEYVSISRRERGVTRRRINTIPSKVSSTAFSGGTIRYESVLRNGVKITSRVPFDQTREMLQPGDEVDSVLDPNAILIYPYPRVGLEKEISLE